MTSGRSRPTLPLGSRALGLALAGAALLTTPVWAQEVSDGSDYRAVLDRYCVGCHNEGRRSGDVALDIADIDQLGAQSDVWEKVLRKVGTRSMPPTGRPRPDDATYDAFTAWLENGLDRAAAADPDPGRPTIHRLNRLEYTNAIRDLLGLEIDAEALLPADDMAYGFDNNADLLTVAPGLLERYMSAARKIGRLAIRDRSIEPDVARYAMSSLRMQDSRMSEDLPFGSRGGAAIRHHFPLDAEYRIRVSLAGNRGEPQQVDIRLDGERLALLPVGRWPEGRQPEPVGSAESADGGELVVRFPASAGAHAVGVSFVQRTTAIEGVAPSRLPIWTFGTGRGFVEPMTLDSLQIEGPYTPDTIGSGSRGASTSGAEPNLFVCRPTGAGDEAACADDVLTRLARRALRRPVTDGDLDTLRGFYQVGRDEGGFETGIQRALEMLLVDPEFLFRIERDPAGLAPATAYRLSDVELASRLSFFLWSSIPDDELLDAAEAGRLSDPTTLDAQVRRMLADDRARVLVSSFGAQWLHLRRMGSVTPDVNAFPAFDDNLREALVRETELFLEHQIGEDRSVVELLTADYTFVNERLARHYGIPNIYGSGFRQVRWNDDRRRGLLGQGSILTVTSLATRTSPVVRGKWVLENVLGTPPPPPPPNVPPLPDRADTGRVTSMRERMEEHRANPVCASCHSRMDPLGFALQHFDAVGKWRDTEGDTPIDPSGALPDGTSFDGLPRLRELLYDRRHDFVTTVTEKLMIYALGRGIESYDRPAIRAIVREAAAGDYRWSELIAGVARSLPFQMRRSES